MAPSNFTEDHLVEQSAIQLMEHELGWDSANAYDEWSSGASDLGREAKREVVLVSRLRPVLEKLNLELPIEDGLIVFAGSIANREFAKSTHDYVEAIRDGLIEDGVMEVIDEGTLRFAKDHIFNSPSQAAAIVLARNANGWMEWKYPDGRTLDEVKS